MDEGLFIYASRTGRGIVYAMHRYKKRGSRTDFGKGRARERVGMVCVKAYYIPMLRKAKCYIAMMDCERMVTAGNSRTSYTGYRQNFLSVMGKGYCYYVGC